MPYLTGSQCSSQKIGVMWLYLQDNETNRAAKFWILCDSGRAYRKLLHWSRRHVIRNVNKHFCAVFVKKFSYLTNSIKCEWSGAANVVDKKIHFKSFWTITPRLRALSWLSTGSIDELQICTHGKGEKFLNRDIMWRTSVSPPLSFRSLAVDQRLISSTRLSIFGK